MRKWNGFAILASSISEIQEIGRWLSIGCLYHVLEQPPFYPFSEKALVAICVTRDRDISTQPYGVRLKRSHIHVQPTTETGLLRKFSRFKCQLSIFWRSRKKLRG